MAPGIPGRDPRTGWYNHSVLCDQNQILDSPYTYNLGSCASAAVLVKNYQQYSNVVLMRQCLILWEQSCSGNGRRPLTQWTKGLHFQIESNFSYDGSQLFFNQRRNGQTRSRMQSNTGKRGNLLPEGKQTFKIQSSEQQILLGVGCWVLVTSNPKVFAAIFLGLSIRT